MQGKHGKDKKKQKRRGGDSDGLLSSDESDGEAVRGKLLVGT